jgi:hypothetical protein
VGADPRRLSVRPRDQAVTNRAFGTGEWVLDLELPEPDPPR